jgi:hypothetical protein
MMTSEPIGLQAQRTQRARQWADTSDDEAEKNKKLRRDGDARRNLSREERR